MKIQAGYSDGSGEDCITADGKAIAVVRWGCGCCKDNGEMTQEEKEHQRRIIACWNACSGIPTAALECQTKKELTARLIEVNKKLVAALEKYELHYGDPLRCARAALKQAKELLP
jgi:hypothetical protein